MTKLNYFDIQKLNALNYGVFPRINKYADITITEYAILIHATIKGMLKQFNKLCISDCCKKSNKKTTIFLITVNDSNVLKVLFIDNKTFNTTISDNVSDYINNDKVIDL